MNSRDSANECRDRRVVPLFYVCVCVGEREFGVISSSNRRIQ